MTCSSILSKILLNWIISPFSKMVMCWFYAALGLIAVVDQGLLHCDWFGFVFGERFLGHFSNFLLMLLPETQAPGHWTERIRKGPGAPTWRDFSPKRRGNFKLVFLRSQPALAPSSSAPSVSQRTPFYTFVIYNE